MKIIGFVLTFALAMTSAYAKTERCPPIHTIKCTLQVKDGGWNCSGAGEWNAEDVHWVGDTFPQLDEGPTPYYKNVGSYVYPICTYSKKDKKRKDIVTVNLSNSKLETQIKSKTPLCKIDEESDGFDCSL